MKRFYFLDASFAGVFGCSALFAGALFSTGAVFGIAGAAGCDCVTASSVGALTLVGVALEAYM